MWETMYDAPGVGLAAPQVGVSLRVVVIDVGDDNPIALVNPGSSSVPVNDAAMKAAFPCPAIAAKSLGPSRLSPGNDPYTGKEVRIKAEDDLLAEALEHEIDHVNGILYIDYLDSPDSLVPLSDAPEVHA